MSVAWLGHLLPLLIAAVDWDVPYSFADGPPPQLSTGQTHHYIAKPHPNSPLISTGEFFLSLIPHLDRMVVFKNDCVANCIYLVPSDDTLAARQPLWKV